MKQQKGRKMKSIFRTEIENLKTQMTNLPWEDENFYISFLTQTYYFVQHSTRLLALASGNTKLTEDSLHRRFSSHISEEKGHEKIALGDLKRLNVTDLEIEKTSTKNLYEVQYYKTERLHPSTLFGYILALEGVASLVCPLFIERIYKKYGIEASKFLKLHVEEDPDHVDKAFEVIETLPIEQQELITSNLVQSFKNYSHFLCAIEVEKSLTVVLNRHTDKTAVALQLN